jgi:ATP-binding cassette subfamily B protein
MAEGTTKTSRAVPEAVRMVLRHYAAQLRIDRVIAVPALLLPALGNILVWYAPPLVVAKMLAAVTDGRRPSVGRLAPYLAAFGIVWLAGEALWRVGVHYLNRTDSQGMSRLYIDAMGYLLDKDLAFFHDNFAGSLTKKVIGYSRSYEAFVDSISFSVFGNLLPLGFVVYILWGYSPWLILTLVGLIAITLALITPLIRRRRALVEAREAHSNALAGHVSDSIANMEAVRAFAREPHEARVHRQNVETYIASAKRSWDYQNLRVSMVTSPLYVFTNVAGLAVAVALGKGGAFSMEAVFVTFSFYASFTRVMWDFNNIYRNIETVLAEAAQFTELLLVPSKVTDPEAPAPYRPHDASVEFRGVGFRYHDRDGEHLFHDLDLAVRSGEKVGLVGHSGGGKTTVTRLLLRFMDVTAGQILVGGQDVASIRQEDLRSMIAYVPQDPAMFHRSLADNIRFGRLDATDEEVREAARLAHAADFIETLPLGYGTLVGERGIKLSGGQRQRVAIARAILRGAPILVLDEATSSLDSESERLIQAALWTLMEERTAIVIAHRLSTVQRMDRLVVLEEGELVEQGTHRELLARRGVYAGLWAHQSGGFLAEDGAEETEAAAVGAE